MKEQLDYARLADSDIGSFNSLFQEAFGATVDPDFLIKKSWGWERDGEFLAFGAWTSEGRLVGSISYYPRTFVRPGVRHLCVEAGDTMVSPDYQGRSIFSSLIRYSFDELSRLNIPVMYGFPNEQAYPGWLKFGLVFPYKRRSGLLILAAGSVAARKWSIPQPLVAAVDTTYAALRRIARRRTGFDVAVHAGVPEALDRALYQNTLPDRLGRERSPDYFRWRYGWSNPDAQKFHTLVMSSEGMDRAFFIVKIPNDGAVVIYEVGCPNLDLLRNAIRSLAYDGIAALERHEKSKFNRIVFEDFTGSEPLVTSLRSAGFLFRSAGYGVMFHATAPQFAHLTDASEWHIVTADGDLY